MRILFSTGSAAGYMLPPSLSDEQVICGPDWDDRLAGDGRVLHLKTPLGQYDLSRVAAQLPADQQPDIVVCLIDASLRNLPRKLNEFSCPTVLLIADTHHMNDPLSNMLRYIDAERYDRHIMLYDRHHLDIFKSAGVHDLYWFPGLTFPYSDEAVQAARTSGARNNCLAFVGQVGTHHPRRAALVARLRHAGLPLDVRALPQTQALSFYGSSNIGFNASLNGDLNLRVFEILSTGAALLTDHLSPDAGLDLLLIEGRERISYGSHDELVERAASAVANHETTTRIGQAGADWFDRHFSLQQRRKLFEQIVLGGVQPELFPFDSNDRRSVYFASHPKLLGPSLRVYEEVQEAHRVNECLRVRHDANAPESIRRLFATLPRIEASDGNDDDDCALAVFSCSSANVSAADLLWCWDADMNTATRLAGTLKSAGYGPVVGRPGCFRRGLEGRSRHIREALEKRDPARALQLIKAALDVGSYPVEVPLFLAEVAEMIKNGSLLKQAAQLALETGPPDPRIRQLAAKAGIDLRDADWKQAWPRLLFKAVRATKPSQMAALYSTVLEQAPRAGDAALRALMQLAIAPVRRAPEAEATGTGDSCLFAFQPWFGFDYLRLVQMGLNAGRLIILFPPVLGGSATLDGLTSENFRDFEYRGLRLWPLCHYKICYRLRIMPEEVCASDHLEAVRQTFLEAAAIVDVALPAFAFYKPATVVVAQGYDLLGSVLRHVAIVQGRRVVALENIFRSDRLLWDDTVGITVNKNQARNYFWRFADSVSYEKARRMVDEYFAMIGSLKSLEHSSPESAAKPGLSTADRPTILYLAQVGIDSSVLYGRMGFKTQADIIITLGEYACANDYRLVVKLHPKESVGYKYSEPAFRQHTMKALERSTPFTNLRANMGGSLVIDEENTLNTYELIGSADVCVTLNSQAGLEALAMGKELIVCGQSFYSGLGFTHEAPDADTLHFAVNRVLKQGVRRNDLHRVHRFFYIFAELYCLPKNEESLLSLTLGHPKFPSLTC